MAHAGQITEVGGAATIGDTVLPTNSTPVFSDWRVVGSNSTTETLKSPAVAVTADGNVTLTFTHRYNFENNFDGGAVYISVDGGAATYVPLAAFSANGYTGLGNGTGGAWPGGENVFTTMSSGYETPGLITSVANLGSLTTGQTISVEFVGKWDGGVLNGPVAWEIGSFKLTDGGAVDIADVDFDADGASAFTTTPVGSGPWTYTTVSTVSRFELDANTDTADRYKPNAPGDVIDLTGMIINVSLLNGTLALADTFTLFDLSGGTTLTGTPASVSLPGEVIWDSSNLATAGTITVSQLPADGTWITDLASNWGTTTNWAGGPPGIVAFGADKNAFFTANITAARTVTLESSRTIGNITFTDSTSSHDLTISGSNTLTLDVTTGKPVIDVTQTGNRQLTISSVIAGSDGLQKNGPGILNLGGANTYTGGTLVNDGILNFGGINMDGFGGGPGSRDIQVTAGKIVQRTHNNLDAAFMKRLVETSDEFAVCLTASGASDVGTGKTVDFSSSTNGANLPNAFLASFATNGGQCRYNGTIIPASDNYRIGYPGTNGALAIIQPLVDVGTPRGLIVGGATPVLVADNTFTGDTVLRAGRLFLGRQLALQNSALNVGNGAGDGITGQICFLSSNTGGATQGQLTDQPTLGGLIGARNLASIYNSANQNNTTRLAITAVLGLTLDVDTGKTHTYSGNARLATGMYLTKTGPGTQVLSGANDYTGPTNVNQGTLALVDGSHKSLITVASGASLGFTLGSPTVSTTSVNLTNGTVKITGTVDNASDYLLMTATGFTFTNPLTQLDTPITDYELQVKNSGTELWLVYTAGGSPYTTWAGSAVFSNDDNGDGVDNGLAWFLGAADTTESALNKLPTVSTPSGFLQLNFTRRNPYLPAKLFVEYGNDLVGWTKLELPAGPGNSTIGGDIDVTVTAGPPDAIQVKIPNSHAAGGKLFGRLSAEENP